MFYNVSREKKAAQSPLPFLPKDPTDERGSSAGDLRPELYLAWQLPGIDSQSTAEATERLALGERMKLYQLRSWAVAHGQARALLAPAAPLHEITAVLWKDHHEARPLHARWVLDSRLRAQITREIETVPVEQGLVRRPEEWPFSSAARD